MARNVTRRASDGRRSPQRKYSATVRRVGQHIGHSNNIIVLKQIRTYNLGIFKEARAYLLEYQGSRIIIQEPRLLDILADDSRRGREPETPHPTKLAGIPLLPAPPAPVALLTATTG